MEVYQTHLDFIECFVIIIPNLKMKPRTNALNWAESQDNRCRSKLPQANWHLHHSEYSPLIDAPECSQSGLAKA